MYFVTAILIILIITTLIDIRKTFFFSGNYHTGRNTKLEELYISLHLLKDANIGGRLSIISREGPIKFTIQKHQDEYHFWFELSINPLFPRRKFRDAVICTLKNSNLIENNKNIDEAEVFNLGFEPRQIQNIMEKTFTVAYGSDQDLEISIWYKDLMVEYPYEKYFKLHSPT